jgi:NADH-quinone oxidoreductase subunit H
MDWLGIGILIIKCIGLTLAATTLFAYFTLFERRLLARFQHRIGPNRAGAIPLPGGRRILGGWLQPAADAGMLIIKSLHRLTL